MWGGSRSGEKKRGSIGSTTRCGRPKNAFCKASALMLLGLCNSAAFSQETSGQRAGRSFGELFNAAKQARSNEAGPAYYDQLQRNYELMAAKAEAEEAAASLERSRNERELREQLVRYWLQLGLGQQEAVAVAQTFVMDETFKPVLARVERIGAQQAIEDAVAAYRRYDYKLANTLLIAMAANEGK